MRIIVIGCGRMGGGVAQTLQLRGHNVTVVDKDESAMASLGAAFHGHTFVGNGLDREMFLQVEIERADGLASVTNSDEVNIVVARLARNVFRVPRVVARVVEPRKAEIYRRLGVHTISTTTWGINRMTNLLSYTELDVVADLGGELELVEAEVSTQLAGRTVFNLMIPGEIHVVAITRGGKTFLPSTNTALQAGDTVHLAVMAASADRVKALFG